MASLHLLDCIDSNRVLAIVKEQHKAKGGFVENVKSVLKKGTVC